MYGGYFDEQIAKQARTAISKAISAGKTNMEVQFPPVPNVEEAKFGKVRFVLFCHLNSCVQYDVLVI